MKLEKVRENFGQNGKDFVTAVDENNVIVVKEVADNETNRDIDKYARAIEESLVKEGIKDVHISYGTNVKEIKEVKPTLVTEIAVISDTEDEVQVPNEEPVEDSKKEQKK